MNTPTKPVLGLMGQLRRAPPQLADRLRAAAGVNRAEHGGRTAASAMNAQDVPLDVADHRRPTLVPADRRQACACAAAGAMAQNVCLDGAPARLAAVIRGTFDARAPSRALRPGPGRQVLLAQSVGRPAPGGVA